MLLKKLSEAAGVSGFENHIRNVIREELKGYVDEIKTDALGNLITYKKGKKNYPIVMLCAHMDEVGLMITSIDKDGFLKFKTVGGIDDRILVSKVVEIGETRCNGVIGAKAIHLQEAEERKKALKSKDLFIDIGAKSREDAEKKVKIGDYAWFKSSFELFGYNFCKGKALDDRAGCGVLIEILKNINNILPIYGVFTVQEEVGLRGSAVAAYSINPDLAIVIEATTANDVAEVEEHQQVTTINKGPALSVMDMTYLANKLIIKDIIKTAESRNIDIQFKRSTLGGTDAGRIQLTKEGIPSVIISIPCRYIHTPSSIISLKDYNNTIKLVECYINKIQKEGLPI
ncbi:MAG: tetrahedral aminopeptidase [Thermosediminibacterales bacterium]|nr:tetrahedral aminopeptidase [Thermosediminibacterales bacterium]